MVPIDSWKERRPSADGAPSISIAFRGEKMGALRRPVAHRGSGGATLQRQRYRLAAAVPDAVSDCAPRSVRAEAHRLQSAG